MPKNQLVAVIFAGMLSFAQYSALADTTGSLTIINNSWKDYWLLTCGDGPFSKDIVLLISRSPSKSKQAEGYHQYTISWDDLNSMCSQKNQTFTLNFDLDAGGLGKSGTVNINYVKQPDGSLDAQGALSGFVLQGECSDFSLGSYTQDNPDKPNYSHDITVTINSWYYDPNRCSFP